MASAMSVVKNLATCCTYWEHDWAGTQRVRRSKDKSIRLAEKRLFPLNYTPKRPQSLKKIDFVPVADYRVPDFSSQEVAWPQGV